MGVDNALKTMESFYTNGTLLENLSRDLVERLDNISSDKAQINKTYYCSFLMAVESDIRYHEEFFGKIVDIKSDGSIRIKTANGVVNYPEKRMPDISYTRLFMFEDVQDFLSYQAQVMLYFGVSVNSIIDENFADGKVKGKSRPGRVKKAGASCKGSVTDLRAKAKKYSGERGKMYHWCANMKAGKKNK